MDLLKHLLQDPKVLIAAAVLVLLVIALIYLSIRKRSRGKSGEEQRVDDMVLREREEQFVAATERIPFSNDPEEVARSLASISAEYLTIKLAAVYAGKEGVRRYFNLLSKPGDGYAGSIRSEMVEGYTRPQLVDPNIFREPNGGSTAMAEVATEGADQSAAEQYQSAASWSGAALLPWIGPFKWRGFFLCESGQAIDVDSLAWVYEPQGQVAARLGMALELESEKSKDQLSTEQLNRLQGFLSHLMESLQSSTGLQGLLKNIADFLGADSAAYWRAEAQTQTVRMVAASGLNPEDFLPIPFGQGFAGRVAQTGETIAVEDAPHDPRCLFPGEARDSGIGSYLGVPVAGQGAPRGVVEVHTKNPQRWMDTSVVALRAASVVVERSEAGSLATVQPTGEPWFKAENSYMRLSESFHGLKSRDEVLEAAVEVLGHALGVSRVIAMEMDERRTSTAYGVKCEYKAPDVPAASETAFSEDFANEVFSASKESGHFASDRSESRSLMSAAMVSRLHVLSELAIPVKVDGAVQALLYLHQCDHVREWSPGEIEFAERLGGQAASALGQITLAENANRDVEAARAEAQKATQVGTRARALIDALPESVIGLDREGRLTFFNGSSRQRLKLRNEDLGRMADMTEALTLVDEGLWDRVNAVDAVQRFESRITTPRQTAQLSAPDRPLEGGGRPGQSATAVSIAVAPIRSENGEINGRLVVISDLAHLQADSTASGTASDEHVARLQKRVSDLESALAEANLAAESARNMAGQTASGSVESFRYGSAPEGEIDYARMREEQERSRRAAQQLLEVNRLKSDFIVNAGHELDASLQTVLGFADLLNQGSYGPLTAEQAEAVRSILAWARRMKSDVEWLVEYGSARSRKLEPAPEGSD